ncbi:hypothetical protein ACIQD3_12470 [Peribacillus loiseleuriae]|uniref:hypothetical protein n=1 Tax=Peribacillus loiseleuriae TaxID=1679170 RepID=UPI0038187C93
MKSYRTFIITFIVLTTLVLGSTAAFNYFIDPMWTFNHKNSYNDVQTVIDERQQKINKIHFTPFEYDTLLIGSSRTTYIDQHDFKNMNVFNFSASDLSIKEYKSFIDYAKKEKGSEFDRIIIGVDFFKSSVQESQKNLSLDEYILKQEEPFYRLKNLISLDILDYSKRNFRLSKKNAIVEDRNYNRDNVAFAKEIEPSTRAAQTKEKIQKFKQVFYGPTYEYNPEFKQILLQLKRENPTTEFILFTTPISAPLFEALVESGRMKDYERWLHDMITVFGGVYNFMYPNSVTRDLDNYFDGHHFYPHVGKLIAYRISNEDRKELPRDFGTFVTKENFTDHLQKISLSK